jgi:hypothetical protein
MEPIGNLLARVASMQQKAHQRPGVPLPKNVVQLPLWPDPVRAVPNGFLRSALFGAIAKWRRQYIDGETIAALDGIEIRYKGQQDTSGQEENCAHLCARF